MLSQQVVPGDGHASQQAYDSTRWEIVLNLRGQIFFVLELNPRDAGREGRVCFVEFAGDLVDFTGSIIKPKDQVGCTPNIRSGLAPTIRYWSYNQDGHDGMARSIEVIKSRSPLPRSPQRIV